VARKSYIAANHELAYRLWRENGQNLDLTARKLRQHPDGFPATRQTLADWRDLYNWKETAARAEAEEHRIGDAKVTAEERALAVLSRVIDKLDRKLDTSEGVEIDSQMLFAFRSTIKTFMEIKAGMAKADSAVAGNGAGSGPTAITVTVTRPKMMEAH